MKRIKGLTESLALCGEISEANVFVSLDNFVLRITLTYTESFLSNFIFISFIPLN